MENENKPSLEENIQCSIDLLCEYIENTNMTGSSATTAIGEIVLKNKLWQMQIRLECEDIISTTEVFETVKIDMIEKTNYKNK